jgi:hypothetical protein
MVRSGGSRSLSPSSPEKRTVTVFAPPLGNGAVFISDTEIRFKFSYTSAGLPRPNQFRVMRRIKGQESAFIEVGSINYVINRTDYEFIDFNVTKEKIYQYSVRAVLAVITLTTTSDFSDISEAVYSQSRRGGGGRSGGRNEGPSFVSDTQLPGHVIQSKNGHNRKGRGEMNGMCYIATAAYGNSDCSMVRRMTAKRNIQINSIVIGEGAVKSYNAASPILANLVAHNGFLQSCVLIAILSYAFIFVFYVVLLSVRNWRRISNQ